MPPIPPDIIARAASQGIEFESGELDKLDRYLQLLLETNRVMNLTAIRDEAQAWERHILDSLTLLPYFQPNGQRLIANAMDVGSGGGLPGIPLAICLPQVRFTLLEATGKKARFLQETAIELGLSNVVIVNERAEQAGQDHHYREKSDIVVARAVGPLVTLAELMIPLARQGGLVLAIKGEKAPEEIVEAHHAVGLLGGRHVDTRLTPTGRIVIIEKMSKTPRDYPRRAGEPKLAPLKPPSR